MDNRTGSTKVYDKQLVRTDSREQKIEKFLSTTLESMPSSSQSFINPTPVETSSAIFKEPITTNTQKDAQQIHEPIGTIQKEVEPRTAVNHIPSNAGKLFNFPQN